MKHEYGGECLDSNLYGNQVTIINVIILIKTSD